MRYLTFAEVIELHRSIMAASGGAEGIRDLAALESALAQPTMGTGTAELYPGLIEKAAALCFSLVSNHPFRDGNKRVGHAAMETFLVLNGFEMAAPVEEQEKVILALAAGRLDREEFQQWISDHIVARA